MTNEEYRQKMLTLERRHKELEEQEDELLKQVRNIRDRQKEIYAEEWKVDGEYAESVTGFKVGDVVKVLRDMQLTPFKMIIDKMRVEESFNGNVRSLHIIGRRVTKTGVPMKNGKYIIDVIYDENHMMHGDLIEHIN